MFTRSGAMYLGEWNGKTLVVHGFGIFYQNAPDKYKGLIYVGNWVDNQRHGMGKRVWLNNAPSWKTNVLSASEIKELVDNTPAEAVCRPFTYTGIYRYNERHDPAATISLKDGTTRVGPWEGASPVGDWWKDHELVVAGICAISPDETTDKNKEEESWNVRGADGTPVVEAQKNTTECAFASLTRNASRRFVNGSLGSLGTT